TGGDTPPMLKVQWGWGGGLTGHPPPPPTRRVGKDGPGLDGVDLSPPPGVPPQKNPHPASRIPPRPAGDLSDARLLRGLSAARRTASGRTCRMGAVRPPGRRSSRARPR